MTATLAPAQRRPRPTIRALGHELAAVAADVPRFATAPLYRRWHQRWGVTDQELVAAMPGDDLIEDVGCRRLGLQAERAGLARDGSSGGGHQPFSVGRVDRGLGGRLDEIVFSGGIGAGRSDDFGQHRDLGRIELERQTLAC